MPTPKTKTKIPVWEDRNRSIKGSKLSK